MNKRNLKSTILAVAMVVVMSIGGIMAYFTDFETTTNSFTFGDIEIELTEPTWKPDEATQIVPNETFLKDPTVKNVGVNTNPAFVFIEVEIPYATIVTADVTTGKRNAAAETELFFIDDKDFNDEEWVELKGLIDDVEYPTKKESATKPGTGTVTHLYAYSTDDVNCAKLAKDKKSTLFTSVTACNAIESQGLEELPVDIIVRSYAIQAENLKNDTTGSKPEGITDAKEVWAILHKQGTTVD